MSEHAREPIRVEDGVLDRTALDTLLELVGGDTAFLAELIDTFLEDTPMIIVEMRFAVASGDSASLRRAAHTLKSNSRTFGAHRLGDLCRQIEEFAVTTLGDDAAHLVDRIAGEYGPVEAALLAERQES
jgi:HPt (histidine-containing phosphotransfer) domain-containing protein